MIEEWKDIEGYEGIYQVSSFGRVKSLERTIIKPHPKSGVLTKYFHRECLIKSFIGTNGYYSVVLKAKQKRNYSVHRLVAIAFVPGYKEGLDVNHKDENKANNHASNLEWVTRRQNINYGTAIKRGSTTRSYQRKAILQIKDGIIINEFSSIHEAARILNMDFSTISKICRNLYGNKTYRGFTFKYKET